MSWCNFIEKAREKGVALSRIHPCAKFRFILPECEIYTSDNARIVFEIVRLAVHELGYNRHIILLNLVTQRDWILKSGSFVSWRNATQGEENIISLRVWLTNCGYDPEQLNAESRHQKSGK